MDSLKAMWSRLRGVISPSMVERAMDEEMRFHIDMEAADLRERGVSDDEARRLARVRFGGVERYKEDSRDAWSIRWLTDLGHDSRYALRTLRRSPVFAVVAVLTLALGIGATTALFSAVNGIVMRPLGYEEPGRLLRLIGTQREPGGRETVAYMDVMDIRGQATTLEEVAAYDEWTAMLTGDGPPERLDAASVTSAFFRVLGVKPAHGRFFRADEDIPGHQPVVVLSHALWRSRFGGDPGVVGRTILVNGAQYGVVGVAPARMEDPRLSDQPPALWRVTPSYFNQADSPRGSRAFVAVARVKPGVPLERAVAEVSSLAAGLEMQYPESNDGRGMTAVPLKDHMVGGVRPALIVLLGATGLLVLVACVNLANLLLARAAEREREMALRTALGAGRGRLARQMMAESLVLAALGGAVGIILARWATSAIVLFAGDSLARPEQVRIDERVLLFAVAATLITGLLFGLAPAMRTQVAQLHAALKEGVRMSGSRDGLSFRNVLISAEVALSLVLVTGAGLLGRSLANLEGTDPGFQSEHILTAQLDPPARYDSAAKLDVLYEAVLERVRAVPGVHSAAVVDILPMSGNFNGMGITFPDRATPPPGEQPSIETRAASEGLFSTFGIPLKRGRDFDETDRAGGVLVAIVDETMASRFWPNQDPIGREISVFNSLRWRIVGVVGAVRQFTLDKDPEPTIYLPRSQVQPFLGGQATLIVRGEDDPASLAPVVRAAIASVDAEVAVSRVRPVDAVVGSTLRQQRLRAGLLALFAAIAFIIGAVGIYGVAAYAVSRRTAELGIRMALGAERGRILRMVVGQSIRPAIIGVTAGLLASLLAARVLAGLLYGVTATDPLTHTAAAIAMGATALIATYLPARRATGTSPMVALRSD